MGLLDKIFSKKEETAGTKQEDMQQSISASDHLAEQILACLTEHTALPVIVFELKKEQPEILDSKIGGAYYVPEGMDIPKNPDSGKEMFLLAQLNFSQFPHLEHFPENGLLQIFIAGDDDVYGCDFEELWKQEKWCIRFLEQLPEQVLEEQIVYPVWDEEIMMPFDEGTEYRLVGRETRQAISIFDYRADDWLQKYCGEFLPEGCKGIWDLEDAVCDEVSDRLETFVCQIGGYPCFTQYDPRENVLGNTEIPHVLLFQLDTVEDIMWGDAGVANFFITEEALKKRDFSKVWYNWDCY